MAFCVGCSSIWTENVFGVNFICDTDVRSFLILVRLVGYYDHTNNDAANTDEKKIIMGKMMILGGIIMTKGRILGKSSLHNNRPLRCPQPIPA